MLARCGGMGSGPDDPRNAQLCEAILAGGRRANAAYCIPIIAPQSVVYDIWKRTAPDLVLDDVQLGCNRWKQKQWHGRDVQVILKQANSTAIEKVLEVARLRVKCSGESFGQVVRFLLGQCTNSQL